MPELLTQRLLVDLDARLPQLIRVSANLTLGRRLFGRRTIGAITDLFHGLLGVALQLPQGAVVDLRHDPPCRR